MVDFVSRISRSLDSIPNFKEEAEEEDEQT
jgi:hypothetical protein